MRITDIYLSGFGPFQAEKALHIDTNDERVLFMGISGSGKTTVLRGIAALWLELKRYMEHESPALKTIGSMAMVIKTKEREAVIAMGEEALFSQACEKHPDAWQLFAGKEGFKASDANIPIFSNVCLMDGEQTGEDSHAPFFITDRDVHGYQRGISNLDEEAKAELIQTVNRLWVGKTLIDTKEGLMVRLSGGLVHPLADTSMGERRIFGLCYLACAKLMEGGILLMDEPDVHVHPSQMIGLLAALENAALKKNGQVMLISHHQEAWNRYDLLGKVVVMGRGA